jgi:hypothetical protein
VRLQGISRAGFNRKPRWSLNFVAKVALIVLSGLRPPSYTRLAVIFPL